MKADGTYQAIFDKALSSPPPPPPPPMAKQ